MLKFHQRLLLLLCTITIVSFIALGAIISHVIYSTVAVGQEGDMEKKARHFVHLYKNDKQHELVHET